MSGGNQICEKPLTDRKRRDRIVLRISEFPVAIGHGECRRNSQQLGSAEATARRKNRRLHRRVLDLLNFRRLNKSEVPPILNH
jgi:hypothetical protein